MFSRFDTIPACDTQTHRQTRDDGYYPHIVCAARVKRCRIQIATARSRDVAILIDLWRLSGKINTRR